MARKVFFSFHYENDNWRVQQVKNMGKVEEQPLLSSQKWEEVAAGGDKAIQKWIDEQMHGKSCLVVLIGSATANRRWVNYEISKAWNDGRGVVGIHIHKLKDKDGYASTKGANPFSYISMANGGTLAQHAKAIDPGGGNSNEVYATISNNLAQWVEDAIAARK